MQNSASVPLYERSAIDLSHGIHHQQFSCQEVMSAFLGHISRLNPQFNAIVSLRDTDELLREAKAADEALRLGQSKGWMHGLPIAVKDLAYAACYNV